MLSGHYGGEQCGPYYPTGFKPVSLLASTKDVRAWPGGTGNYKIAANYAPGVQVQLEAAAQGYQQILWLFGEDHELTEVGTMNLFVVLEKEDGSACLISPQAVNLFADQTPYAATELVTPPLKDIILPGVTRDSVLSIARLHESGKAKIEGLPDKLQVSERKICMPEIVEAAEKGRLKEIFGSGTAVIISTVESIGFVVSCSPSPKRSTHMRDAADTRANASRSLLAKRASDPSPRPPTARSLAGRRALSRAIGASSSSNSVRQMNVRTQCISQECTRGATGLAAGV